MLVSQSDIYQMLAYSIRYDCNGGSTSISKMMRMIGRYLNWLTSQFQRNRALSIRVIMLDLECDAAVLGKGLRSIYVLFSME